MATSNYRIVIPKDVENYRKLIDNIKKENDKQGTDSPVHSDTADIDQGALDMAAAELLEAEAEALRKQAEKKTEERDILWKKTTLANERGWRKKFEGEYIKAIHKMGDFGYQVDTSPKAKPKPPVK